MLDVMVVGMKQITVRLDDEVHRKVKMRAASEGHAMEVLGREFFEGYANGGLVAGEGVGSREPVVVESRTPASPASLATSRGGLGAADDNDDGTVTSPLRPASAAPRPHHRADPKDKASQEHGKKERTQAKGLCPHRVPLGSYCKRCEEATT